jgi:hypothetical protein
MDDFLEVIRKVACIQSLWVPVEVADDVEQGERQG